MCFVRCPNPRAGREKPSKTMQIAKKGKFITDSSQGSCRIQRSGAGSESPEPQLLHKFIGWTWQLVAGLSGLVTCLQSNSIGTNFRGLCSNLGVGGLFRFASCSLCSLLGACWLAGSRRPDGGGESHHFRGNRNPGPGRLPAPAAPHYVHGIFQARILKWVTISFSNSDIYNSCLIILVNQ